MSVFWDKLYEHKLQLNNTSFFSKWNENDNNIFHLLYTTSYVVMSFFFIFFKLSRFKCRCRLRRRHFNHIYDAILYAKKAFSLRKRRMMFGYFCIVASAAVNRHGRTRVTYFITFILHNIAPQHGGGNSERIDNILSNNVIVKLTLSLCYLSVWCDDIFELILKTCFTLTKCFVSAAWFLVVLYSNLITFRIFT